MRHAMMAAMAAWLGSFFVAPLAAQQQLADGEVQQQLTRWAAEHRMVGMAIGRLEGARSAVITGGLLKVGMPGPVEPATDFEAGSITKAFTGTLLADMVLRHEVALDDPVAKYLPGWTVPTYQGRAITLLDLATHTSGLPRLPDNMHPADGEDPYADYGEGELRAFLAGYQLRRAPGGEYEYSNLGMGLLGLALARRAGMPFEALLRQRILEPLQMHQSYLSHPTEVVASAASGHTDRLLPTKFWRFGALAAAGALHTTAGDLLKFAAAVRDTTTGPLAKVIALAIRPRRPYHGADSIGLAWHHLHLDGDDVVWHNGGTGGFRSWLGVNISRQRAVVVLANAGGEFPADGLGIGLLRGGSLVPPPSSDAAAEVRLTADDLEPLVGRYRLSPQFAIDITREGDQLYAQATGQQRLPVYATSRTAFFFKVVKAELLFQRDGAGRIAALVLRQNGIDQVARRVEKDRDV